MNVEELAALADAGTLRCDVLVVGGGPAGLTVARALAGTRRDVLVLESGRLQEAPETEELNTVIGDPDAWTAEQLRRRETFHAPQARLWSNDRQAFGVRCRALGGSTAAWAGKSAAFDTIDFAARPWVPNSGWPVRRDEIELHLDRAASSLNLGVNCYDDGLWEVMHRRPPEPRPDPAVMGSFFWQFARSTIDPMDVMRVGAEFLANPPENCRVLTGATVLEVLTDPSGGRATGVAAGDMSGRRHIIEARAVVLAASAIENARLLLNSRSEAHPDGVGNRHGNVGRYLMDHPSAVVAHFEPDAVVRMAEMFGFFGVKSAAGVNMYMRGLAPTQQVQEAEKLLNCAVFMPGERAPDDPWDAFKRLLKRKSGSPASDVMAIVKSPGLVAKGAGRLAFQSKYFPKPVSRFVIDQIIRFRPSLAVEEYMTGGVPHKLVGLPIHAICEQAPDRDNRVYLSDRTDRFGMRLPAVRWKVGEMETGTLIRLTEIVQRSLGAAGLPKPVAEPWVTQKDGAAAAIIDMAHTAGTTRMSETPTTGVVDANCRVFGCDGLYVAGGSVFPTSGHANSTLMIVAFAHRLADHLAGQLR
ncbi:choline dehydrogenase-like flavoprotein [Rhodovulum iodosum]|uniref:Choline dehydrogenase-like flavoprotein n=1 Tax=Rhodovulum iodosum TaxID=68291 RepID=A0ABV3XWD6_9RHOB|nr:GMC family oxidoreductase [Rhodovulum robiginosum]RSK38354.1 GMC family oxidoreductase [Rhodovulum robiginosum]